MEKNVIDS